MGNKTLLQRWQSLPTKQRMGIAIGGSLVIIFLIANSLQQDKQTQAPTKLDKPNVPLELGLPGSNGHDLTIERLSVALENVKKDLDTTKTGVGNIEKQNETKRTSDQTASPEQLRELQELKQKVAELQAGQLKTQSLDDALPGANTTQQSNSHNQSPQSLPSANSPQATNSSQPFENSPTPKKEVEPARIRIIGDARKDPEAEEEKNKPKQVLFLPAGSNFEGVLLNGMDAPTSGVAQKHPVPALMRINSDAILPNRYRYDVRECFAMVSGYGELSSERVQLQTVVISCVKTDGSIIESKIEGYVVGEDGKVGLRGKVVTKQGQLLAKTFAAGFFSGVGQSLAPLAVPQLNTTPGSTQQYQAPNLNATFTAGAAQGITQTAKSISQFYLDMAKEMFPIIEIGANRKATIILQKGIELKLSGESK